MLTCHPDIVIPPECGFALWLEESFGGWNGVGTSDLAGFLGALLNARKFETWGLNYEQLETFIVREDPRSYPELVGSVYRCYASKVGKPDATWGDKNNYYLNHIDRLKALFPSAFFVHIVRDPRSVVCSYLELAHKSINSVYSPILPRTVEESAQAWKNDIQIICDFFDKFEWERVIEIRFENLVVHPGTTLQKLCYQLGQRFDAGMLDYHIRNRREQLEPAEFLQWKGKTVEPPRKDRTNRFESDLSIENQQLVTKIAASEMARYGYLTPS
jgi:hypothetical protein